MIKPSTNVSDYECEIDEHDPRFDRTAVVNLPDGKGGTFMICEACMKDIFESVVKPRLQ